jgi:hypothetical protein
MNRRPRLPGADELFRATGGAARSAALAEVSDDADGQATRHGGRTGEGLAVASAAPAAAATPADRDDDSWHNRATSDSPPRPVRIARRTDRHGDELRPTGRERHDEKITVYCSPEELLQLEQARLTLRGGHGLAVDRGRIVREAVAVVLADLEAKGESSILVRRLRGR